MTDFTRSDVSALFSNLSQSLEKHKSNQKPGIKYYFRANDGNLEERTITLKNKTFSEKLASLCDCIEYLVGRLLQPEKYLSEKANLLEELEFASEAFSTVSKNLTNEIRTYVQCGDFGVAKTVSKELLDLQRSISSVYQQFLETQPQRSHKKFENILKKSLDDALADATRASDQAEKAEKAQSNILAILDSKDKEPVDKIKELFQQYQSLSHSTELEQPFRTAIFTTLQVHIKSLYSEMIGNFKKKSEAIPGLLQLWNERTDFAHTSLEAIYRYDFPLIDNNTIIGAAKRIQTECTPLRDIINAAKQNEIPEALIEELEGMYNTAKESLPAIIEEISDQYTLLEENIGKLEQDATAQQTKLHELNDAVKKISNTHAESYAGIIQNVHEGTPPFQELGKSLKSLSIQLHSLGIERSSTLKELLRYTAAGKMLMMAEAGEEYTREELLENLNGLHLTDEKNIPLQFSEEDTKHPRDILIRHKDLFQKKLDDLQRDITSKIQDLEKELKSQEETQSIYFQDDKQRERALHNLERETGGVLERHKAIRALNQKYSISLDLTKNVWHQIEKAKENFSATRKDTLRDKFKKIQLLKKTQSERENIEEKKNIRQVEHIQELTQHILIRQRRDSLQKIKTTLHIATEASKKTAQTIEELKGATELSPEEMETIQETKQLEEEYGITQEKIVHERGRLDAIREAKEHLESAL